MHEHPHPHPHPHEHANETIALLKYAVMHNKHHIEELNDLAAQFAESGEVNTSDLITEAADVFKHGTELLESALNLA